MSIFIFLQFISGKRLNEIGEFQYKIRIPKGSTYKIKMKLSKKQYKKEAKLFKLLQISTDEVYGDLSLTQKPANEKTAYKAIIIGLIGGFLLFPAPDFSKSLLVGIILPVELFPPFVSQSLLFLSFLIATFVPIGIWKLR